MEINLEALKQERNLVNDSLKINLFNKCIEKMKYINNLGKHDCYVELNDNECKFAEQVISMLEKENIQACEANATDSETLHGYNYIYMFWGDNPNEGKWNIRWEKYGALYCLGIILAIPCSAFLITLLIIAIQTLFRIITQ